MRLNSQALLLSWAVGSQALPQYFKRDEQRVCPAWKDEDDARNIWDTTRAGVIGDEYITEHGVANWVANLDKEIFDAPTSFFCYDRDTDCKMKRRCDEYAVRGKEGAYYLYRSLTNAVTVLDTMHSELESNAIRSIMQVPQITSDFGEQPSEKKLNTKILIAASFGMIAGLTAPIAPISGAAGLSSGMFAFMGNAEPQAPEEVSHPEGRLFSLLEDAFVEAKRKIEDIRGALVGEEGKDQSLIPKEMLKQSFRNPVMNALGSGQWLHDDPARGVKKIIESSFNQIKQVLVWRMIRHARRGFYFIDSDVDKKKCGDGDDDHPEEFWDNDANGCVKLMEVTEKTEESVKLKYVSQKDHDLIWGNGGDYDLDIQKTWRNAYECWVDNGGRVAEVNFKDHDFSDISNIPKCWFGIPLIRGSKFDRWSSDIATITASPFPGQENEKVWYGGFTDDGVEW